MARAKRRRQTVRTPRRGRALELLLQGKTVTEAARELKISPSSVYSYMRDPEFVGEMQRRRTERMDAVDETLGALGLEMLQLEAGLARDTKIDPAVRQRAMADLLDRTGIERRVTVTAPKSIEQLADWLAGKLSSVDHVDAEVVVETKQIEQGEGT